MNHPVNKSAAADRFARLRQRILALVMIGIFFGVQYIWWLDARRYRNWFEPSPVLGPLYFLANKSKSDDWLGIMLLVILVPAILSVAIRPTRATAILAVSAILAWMLPGELMIWRDFP